MKRHIFIILTSFFFLTIAHGQICNNYYVYFNPSTKRIIARFYFNSDSTFNYKLYGDYYYGISNGTYKENKRILTLNNQPMKVVYKNVYDTVWIDTEKGYYSLNKKLLISPVVYYKLLLRGDKIIPVFKVYDLKYFFERLLIFARLKKCKNFFIRVDKKNLEKEYL